MQQNLAEPVILIGEQLDGAVVTNVVLFREGLNELRELAFLAQFDDGRTAVFRATPTTRSVPEPEPLTFLSTATVLGLGIFLKRKLTEKGK